MIYSVLRLLLFAAALGVLWFAGLRGWLLVLVAEMVLSYGFGMKGEENPLRWWPQPHGFIYMVYLVATALLGFKVGWSLTRIVLVMLAGCVPFLSFWVERKVAAEVEGGLAAARQ